jgi:secondary thiamine-phosphate synthase enzyme
MNIDKRTVNVSTDRRFDVVRITAEIQAAVEASGLTDAFVTVTTPHTTAAVATNEYERRLFEDIEAFFAELVPADAGYKHDRHHIATNTQPNAHAHIICAMLQSAVVLTWNENSLELGTWEDVLLFDADGPSERTVAVTILS